MQVPALALALVTCWLALEVAAAAAEEEEALSLTPHRQLFFRHQPPADSNQNDHHHHQTTNRSLTLRDWSLDAALPCHLSSNGARHSIHHSRSESHHQHLKLSTHQRGTRFLFLRQQNEHHFQQQLIRLPVAGELNDDSDSNTDYDDADDDDSGHARHRPPIIFNEQFVLHKPAPHHLPQHLPAGTAPHPPHPTPPPNHADIDECQDERACGRGATCDNLPGSFRCSCPAGFTGDPSLECFGK